MHTTRALVVDDSASTRAILQRWLTHAGIPTETAASVDEAQAIFERDPPTVAVVDLSMPHRGGGELTLWIKAQYPACRVVMYSAKPDTDDFAKVRREMGVDVWLTKAGDPAAVIRAVRGEQP